ncbi:MAG: cyclic nucleotide-binding domain-containing protein, partial [Cyanobacteriota bacterium]|nr:cyclic nucleotide-binding domain-containing protein [Cyanobacteriota bacterium]
MLVSAKDLERQQIRLSRNEILFSKGDPCDGLYLLEAGTMDVEIPREQGPSLTINRLHAVNLLGELSLFGDLERTATCRCGSSKAVLWKYDNTTALARIDQERDLRLGFMHHLSLICANTLQYAEELGELAHQASQGK